MYKMLLLLTLVVGSWCLHSVHCTADRFQVEISPSVPLENCTHTLQALERLLLGSLRRISELGLEPAADTVEVVLPTSWRLAACQPTRQPLATAERFRTEPNLVLRNQGTQPVSVQPQGCGAPGLGVYLPLVNLLEDEGTLEASLTVQLINSRFGIYLQTPGNLSSLSAEDSDYDWITPTKHNLICEGRSPSSIVGAVISPEPVNFTAPEFRYVVQAEEHYVLVLDQTKVMDQNHRWTNIKRAFYRFINSLKDGTTLSIITFGREAGLALPPTVVTETNREGLHGRIPRRTEEVEQPCVSCGLHLAKDVLKGSSGSIILVTGNPVSSLNLSSPGDLFSILYPGVEEARVGTTYSILEEQVKRPVEQLNEVLIDIMNRVEEDTVAKIHESDHLSYEFSGTFIVEENLREDITVTLNVEDKEKVEYFEVIDPSGEKNIFSKFEDGMVLLRFPGTSDPGIWTFHAKLYPEAGLPAHRMSVDVVGRGRHEEIRVVGLETPTIEDASAPVSLLVRLERGEMPVYGADIRAIVSGPDTETEIVLKDGAYPDIQVGDAVYSGYLTGFSTLPGYYTVRIIATDNNGQAYTYSGPAPIPTGSFRRFVYSPSFFVGFGVDPELDPIPPSRVTDLTLVPVNSSLDSDLANSTFLPDTVNSSSPAFQLSWTSPGQNYNEGRAERYEVRCHTNPLALSEDNFSSQGILVSPPEDMMPQGAGSLERIYVSVPWTNEVFYYALAAYDKVGNRGRISNLVQALVVEETTVAGADQIFGEPGEKELRLGKLSWFLDTNQIYIIAGVVGGILLMVVVLVLSLIVRAKRITKTKTQWVQDTYEAGFDPDSKVEKVETESGIYSWLESLPRSDSGQKKGCEEGSNSSRPTTSTDDSISESGDPRHSEEHLQHYSVTDGRIVDKTKHDEPSHDDYAQQVLTRSLYYYSFRDGGLVAGRAGGLRVTPDNSIQSGADSGSIIDQDYNIQNQIRRKRHESVV